MTGRTYGATRDCLGCRYWSEMMAKFEGVGPVLAFCLNTGGPRHGEYTPPSLSCDGWASGRFGALDDPYADLDDPVRSRYYKDSE